MSNADKNSKEGRGRVIAFEGVDGAGKSTVLRLVADHLRESGVDVYLPRVGKEHSARPVREVRRLTRDRRNYELRPRAELLLYAAREAQVLDQQVRPALARGATVLLDRSMMTPIVLGAHGRGLELEAAETICAAASAGLEPDLTLIFDVDPRTSRVRKRLDKARSDRFRDGGRKGLAGSDFKARIRDGYLELAERDGLSVFHTERSGPQEVAARVIAQLETGTHEEPASDRQPQWCVDPKLDFASAVETLPPLLQLYFTRGLVLGRAIRDELFETEPRLAIWATDFCDPLFERAASSRPDWVLARIANAETRGFEGTAQLAEDLRGRLLDSHPEVVARSLARSLGEAADALRTQLCERAPGAVLESLLGRSDDFALDLRARLWTHGNSYERARALQMCEDEDAWKRRKKLLDKDPAVALPSLAGLAPERVDPLLTPYLKLTPKSALKALRGRDDAHAYALRDELLDTGREVVDTIMGLDDERAWELRERCFERWPSTVVASMRGLPLGQRERALAERCHRAAPDDLFLLRRLYQLDNEVDPDLDSADSD